MRTHQFAILTGVHERMLYVLLDVHDQHPLFDAAGNNSLDPGTFGDRVWLGFEDPQGDQQRVLLAASGPGPITARRIVDRRVRPAERRRSSRASAAPGSPAARATAWRCACRCRCSAARFGVLVDDRDTPRRRAGELRHAAHR